MAADLWLVRHGETDWNRRGLYQGQSDIPLNENGLAQARRTAADLAARAGEGQAFAALYCSPLLRARQTAEACAGRLGLAVRIDARLREVHQGDLQGTDYAEVVARFRERVREAPEDGWKERAPGGESVEDVAQRMAEAADEYAAAHPGAAVLVFSHGLALATLVCRARGIWLGAVYEHIPGNGGAEVIGWPPRD